MVFLLGTMRHLLLLALLAEPSGAWQNGKNNNSVFGWNKKASTEQKFFKQSQDHFDNGNENTWMQAYYVNETFWAGADSGAPVFVYIGGEGPLSSHSVTSNFVTDWLPTTKGILFSVEHRYYGCIRNTSSCPYTDATPDHLRFLSSQQAIADLASFHRFAEAAYGIKFDTKWVAIGGSYPGMLAAFVRVEYPDLFDMAVASSAPVNGELDMVEFENVVSSAYALNVEGVRGSPACRDAIAYGHHTVGELLPFPDGRKTLAALFPTAISSATWLEDPTNQRTFAGCGVASFPAQANSPRCSTPGCGISQICSIMTNASLGDPLHRLAALRLAQDGDGSNMLSTCEMDWEMPGDVPTKYDENTVDLYWGYQTCTEFGFYQTCEVGSDCFFSQGLVSFDNDNHHPNDFCSEVFNISTRETSASIKRTNDHYAHNIYDGTRIIWVNGNVDPWHGRSHLSPPGEDQPVIWPVEGAAHCAWMSAASQGEQASLVKARQAIFAQLSVWWAESDQVITI